MIAAKCKKCGNIGCNNTNEICNNFGKEGQIRYTFTNISVSVSDVMIDTLSNDQDLGAYVRGLLNRTR